MLKGHTKIELTNVKTGEKKTVEKHNLVTNGVASLYGKLTNDYLLSGNIDLYFGGLLLFENPIDENVDNYHLPLGNRMIGNGAVGYAPLTPPEFGAYNVDESSLTIENGTVTRKYVYDFSTSKGNGTISAVSLANKYCGFYGAGNAKDYTEKPSTYLDDLRNEYATLNYKIVNKTNYSDYSLTVLMVDYMKNTIITWENIGSELRLFYIYYPFTKLNPLLESGTIYKVNTITFPEKITSEFGTSFHANVFSTPDGNYMLFTKSTSCGRDETFFIWKVSETFNEKDVYKLTNPTDYYLKNEYPYYDNYCTIVDKYFIFKPTYSNIIFKMELSNPTNVKSISYIDNFTSSNESYLFNLNNKVFITTSRYSNNAPSAFIYDYVNDTVCRINPHMTFNPQNTSQGIKHFYMNRIKDRIVAFFSGRFETNSSPAIFRNWFVLSTINNLPEPVTKTSDMTMKVTYTITGKIEQDEEE